MVSPAPAPARGVIISIAASVMFGVISLIGGHLEGFSPVETTAWRVVVVLVALIGVVRTSRSELGFRAQAAQIARRPRLVAVFALSTVIMGLQLWVFMWGPANGYTQDVAFGYFLLPLTMVVTGGLFFGDRLTGLQRGAVAAAAVGVVAQLVLTGSIGWPVLLIAVMYPVYFGLRRWVGLDSMTVFLLEIAVLAVPSVVVIIVARVTAGGFPETWPLMAIMAALSGVAMTCYILAAKLLTLSLFGLLSYLEPVLVLVAALLLGEALTPSHALVYLPILVALVLLGLSGRRPPRRRATPHTEEPPL